MEQEDFHGVHIEYGEQYVSYKKGGDLVVGVQCKGCCSYKKRLFSFLFKGWKKGKCIRQSNHSNKKGVCWMTPGEGEY